MSEIHDLVYHGNGGFTYNDVYNMPIQYRKYHIRKINDYIEKQNEEYENARGNKTIKNTVNKPNIPQADFSSKIKAPKK
jgi:hypothetical protein